MVRLTAIVDGYGIKRKDSETFASTTLPENWVCRLAVNW